MKRKSKFYDALIEEVVYNSVSDIWEEAVKEWEIYDVKEDETLETSCICGHDHLRYLFTIENKLNGNVLYPIGSSCIKKFGRSDLKHEVEVQMQLFQLLHAVEQRRFLELSPEYFSRKLFDYLFEMGAFKPSQYNNNNPESDYYFMLDMFNKRSVTEKQKRKVDAIIVGLIKPFLQKTLAGKVKK